jgi:hypothetical protein
MDLFLSGARRWKKTDRYISKMGLILTKENEENLKLEVIDRGEVD